MVTPRVLVAVLSAALCAMAISVTPSSAGTPTAQPTRSAAAPEQLLDIARWQGRGFSKGSFRHAVHRDGVAIGRNPTRVTYRDPYGRSGRLAYDRGRYLSPWVRPGFGLDELIASYNAETPVGTFVEISARGRTPAGRTSSWDSLGRWASHDVRFHRTSPSAQRDDLSAVAVDTLVTERGVVFERWQLRVSLMRRAGTGRTPVLTMLGAVASRLPSGDPATSRPAVHSTSLSVPKYSQEIHTGEYPQWNGGGEAWCSPTSTAMVLGYWNRGPTPKQYSWVKPEYADPWVDYAARHTYASRYDGTGDWPFNTAYAAEFGLDAFVTRLRSLREAELFLAAGIPLVASISFGPGELQGAPIDASAGHLLVIRGFTTDGRVIANDPAAPNDKTVRRVYQRGQFERAWVGSSGGVVYVVHPASKPLPAPRQHSNW